MLSNTVVWGKKSQPVDSACRYPIICLKNIPVRSWFHCPHAWQILRWVTKKNFGNLSWSKADWWEQVLFPDGNCCREQSSSTSAGQERGKEKRWGYPQLLPSCCLKLLEKIQGTQAIFYPTSGTFFSSIILCKQSYSLPLNDFKSQFLLSHFQGRKIH